MANLGGNPPVVAGRFRSVEGVQQAKSSEIKRFFGSASCVLWAFPVAADAARKTKGWHHLAISSMRKP